MRSGAVVEQDRRSLALLRMLGIYCSEMQLETFGNRDAIATQDTLWHAAVMKKDRKIEILTRQRELAKILTDSRDSSPEFTKWHRDTEIAIARIFGQESRNLADFKKVNYSLSFYTDRTTDAEIRSGFIRGLENAGAVLSSMIDEVEEYSSDEPEAEDEPDRLNLLERLCLRFHAAARQLQARHGSRTTLTIEDEYDVQDLLHAILRLHFDDIRAEEWSPSYAGAASRVDFLLKQESIVVEVKKTRARMTPKTLGEELIIDRARYEKHPDCKTLVCFVYDPEGRIGNPVGIERDLEDHGGKLKVRVIIAPKS